MMHLLRKNDVAPLLRSAMMRCLPQCAVGHTSLGAAVIIGGANIICQRQTSFKKRTFVGRQKCVFCCLKRDKRCLNRKKTNKRCPMKIYHFFENLLKYFSSFLSMRGVYFLSNALKIKCKIISNTMNKAKYPPIVIA